MNKIEKKVYDIVKKNPQLKNKIRNIYQTIFDILPDKKNYSENEIIERKGYFFGFHDICPFSYDEKYILSNKLEIPLRMPTTEDLLTVGYWDSDLKKYTSVCKTKVWNYHKGCRLQWLGEKNYSFIFNNIVNGKLGATIYKFDGNKTMSINYPIDTVSPNGKYATSFSYERLNRYMPGYGYCFSDQPFFEENSSSHTGLFLIDIDKNLCRLIVSLETLAKIDPDETMKGAHHYVTHTEFSPNGNRIAFLHRWTYEDPEKRYTRLVTCKLDGSDIYISPTSGMVSHFDWDNKHGILAYCQVDGVDGYFIFENHKMRKYKHVIVDLNSDGHQFYVPQTDYFITDTYPDKRRHAKLYLCNINSGKYRLIADLKSPKKFQSPTTYKHWACDLHPRVSPSGKFASFDSVHSGQRAFCVMKIGK